MKKNGRLLRSILFFTAVFVTAMLLAVQSVSAESTVSDYRDSTKTNIDAMEYTWYHSNPIRSYLTPMNDGGLMRFEAIDFHQDNNADMPFIPYQVEYYNSDRELTASRQVPLELPIFGGFYSSADSYFIVSGQDNEEENNSKEVFRITRYDKNWNRLSSSSIYGADTYIPFDAGSLRAAEYSGKLIIRTSHEMYDHGDGRHHQSNFTIVYNMASSRVERYYVLEEGDPYGYSSHSFNQFVKAEGDYVISLDHGDAYPRSIVLSKKNPSTFGAYSGWNDRNRNRIDVIPIPGNTGYNFTGITLGGFELSSDAYLAAGAKIDDLSRYEEIDLTKNIFVAAVSKDLSGVSLKQITNYSEYEMSASTPHLVKVNDNRFILLWSRYDSSVFTHESGYEVYYTELDAKGNTIGSVHTLTGFLSDCQPVISNNKLVWYTWEGHTVTFYEISLSDLSQVKITDLLDGKIYRAPHKADTSAIIDSGKLGAGIRYQLNQSGTMYFYGNGALNSFGSQALKFYNTYRDDSGIKKVVVETGVICIPFNFNIFPNIESAVLADGFECDRNMFSDCEKLKEVILPGDAEYIMGNMFRNCVALEKIELPENIYSIGDYAFENCKSLKKIVLPASVRKIGSYAFSGCKGLKSIELSEKIESVYSAAFMDCSGLETVIIKAKLDLLSRSLFSGCSSLKSIDIPNGIKNIEQNVFDKCTSLQRVTLPASLQSIGYCAFNNCPKLNVITIPEKVTSIGNLSLGYIADDNNYNILHKEPFVIRGKSGSEAQRYASDNSMNFVENKPLSNDSKLGSTSIRLGQVMNISTGASGGTGYYKYSVYIKAPGENKWTEQKINTTASDVEVKPVHSGKHYILVKVTDLESNTAQRVLSFEVYAPLKNNSVLSSKSIILGKTIAVVPKASGGSGTYVYTVKYKKSSSSKWTVLKPAADGKLRIKPTAAVKYDIKVSVKDSRGVSVSKTLSLSVLCPLENKSVISSAYIQLGKSVNITAKASGGTGGNKYAVYYKKASSSEWVMLKDYSTKTTVNLKPATAVVYDVCVKVKDSSKTIVKKYFKLSVYKPLRNLSYVSSVSVKKGEKVRVICKASGGKTDYKYGVFYKKSTASDWITLVNYSGVKTAVFKPASAVKYNVCVIAKDSAGNIERKYFEISVKA